MGQDLNIFPKQRLSFSKKMAKNQEWGKSMVDHLLLHYASGGNAAEDTTSYERKLANYQLYNNILNQKDFERECNPLGLEIGQFKDEIQPYNKTYNKIQVLLGEELKRPFNYRTVLTNTEGIRVKQMAAKQMLQQFIQTQVEQLIMQLTQGEEPTEEDQQFIDTLVKPEELDRYMKTDYREAREELADQILDYLITKLSLKELMNDAFKHALISGEEFVWVGVENGEPTVQVLNPLGVIYHKSPEVKYIQNGLYAGYRTLMTTGDVLDRFGDDLKDEDVEKLEGTLRGMMGDDYWPDKKMAYPNTTVYDRYLSNYMNKSYQEGSYGRGAGTDWLVSHVEWKSQKRVGFITYINDYGEESTDMVSEEFKAPDYAEKVTETSIYGKKTTKYVFDGKELEYGWVPEVWQGVRIGDDIYCDIRPKIYQYRSLDNPKDVKLGYHGVVYNNMNARSVSLMDRMKPFQYLYFVVVHKLKKLIAKDRGKLFHFDTSMVDENIGLEKTLYYLEEMDIDFYNPLQNAETPGSAQRGKVTASTDRSNMQHIMNYINLMHSLDEQIGDVAGITRQREGQISPNEAVTNSQQNIMQSSTITEAVYFQPHSKLWEQVLNSMVQCAQAVYKNKSMIKQYVLDDLSVATLELTPESLQNADFGVFVSNSARDNEVFDSLKMLAQPLLQNDKAKMGDIIRLFKATSTQELEKQILQSEEQMQQEMMQQIQAQQEAQQAATQAQLQMKQMEFEFESQLQAQKDQAEMQRIIIEAQLEGNMIDPMEAEKLALERAKIDSNERIKKMEVKSKEKISDKDNQTDEKIAKINAKNRSKPTNNSK